MRTPDLCPPYEELKRLYVDEKMSCPQIAKIYNVDSRTPNGWLRRLGIERRKHSGGKGTGKYTRATQSSDIAKEFLDSIRAAAENKRQSGKTQFLQGYELNEFMGDNGYFQKITRIFGTWRKCMEAAGLLPTTEDLKRLYLDERKSAEEIGKMYGASQTAVWRWLIRDGIPRRISGDYNGKAKGVNHYNWQGGRRIYRGYVYICPPGGGKAVLEHRYLMEQHLGRKLTKQETIHHLNARKDDNRISNLAIVNNSEHPRGKADNYHKHYINRIRELEEEVKHLKSLLPM